MVLSDIDINQRLTRGTLVITNLRENAVQPASVDLHLAAEWKTQNPHGEFIPATRHYLVPGEFVLASTDERVELPADLAANCQGLSSLGRKGLSTNQGASWVDPGFKGTITLEIANLSRSPVEFKPGMRVCQLVIYRLTSPAEYPYGHDRRYSKYQDQQGPGEAKPDLVSPSKVDLPRVTGIGVGEPLGPPAPTGSTAAGIAHGDAYGR